MRRSGYILLIAGLLGIIFVVSLHFILEFDSTSARLLLDHRQDNSLYPFTVQNLMWLVFFMGLGEVSGRLHSALAEERQLHQHYLPEDERTILQAKDLASIYKRIRESNGDTELFLPRLIKRVILQFYTHPSVEHSHHLLNSSLDLYLHEIDLRYNMLRYITWLIPSLGFMGTVIGVTLALNYAGTANFQDPSLLAELTQRLGVAFYTTLLGLIQAAILVFITQFAQGKEEYSLNLAGQYCLDNLINRLYLS